MNHKFELAILRDQQLAKLREQTGSPERFTLDFACAMHDLAFRVTFARLSPAKRFRCESVDKSDPRKATALKRLQGLFGRGESKQFRADEVNLGSVRCADRVRRPQALDALQSMQSVCVPQSQHRQ